MKVIVYLAISPSDRYYVGITKRGLKSRLWYHYYATQRGSKLPFHNCLRKYGKKVKFSILAEVDSWSEACILEKQYIKQYNSKINGYNATDGGDGVVGFPCSESLKQLFKFQQLGRLRSNENKLNCSIGKGGKPFLMIHIDSGKITEWQSLRECERTTGVLKPHIRRCLLGTRHSTKGFKFSYKGDV